ncbi:MauE/DoxX family redox-associated membrane protein [Plantactinospora solaniradicis]|uniref:MauE/DoxX family redox-associated membrane protein n=1 Tax=Plantactinospora solaniradicis TaxID=1723736 RepID=A0ABW1K9M9_9ACTN
MVAHAVVTAALGAALLLVAGGVGHLRDRRALATALASQRVLPRWARALVTVVLGPVQAIVGVAAVTAWLAVPRLAAPAVALVGALFVALGLYTTVLRIRVPAAPCGCFGASGPVTPVVVARAWLFAGAAGAAVPVLWGASGVPLGPRALLLLPAVLVALAGWLVAEVFTVGRSTQPIRRPPALS